MKKIPKWCYVLSALLIIWSAVDFYHYFAIGRGLLDYYEAGSVDRLVQNSLMQGIVKLLLAGLIMLAAGARAKMKNHKPSTETVLTAFLAGGMIIIWSVSMFFTTWITAQEINNQLPSAQGNFISKNVSLGVFESLVTKDSAYYEKVQTDPDYFKYALLEACARGNSMSLYADAGYEGYLPLQSDSAVSCDTAVLIYDKDGKLLCRSGDYVLFTYMTQEQWENGGWEGAGDQSGYFYINEKDGALYPELAEFYCDIDDRNAYKNPESYYYQKSNGEILNGPVKVTGFIENGEVKPVSLAYIDKKALEVYMSEQGYDTDYYYIDGGTTVRMHKASEGEFHKNDLNQWDKEGHIQWKYAFDHTDETDAAQQDKLKTIYCLGSFSGPDISQYNEKPVMYYGVEFPSLRKLTEQVTAENTGLLTTGRKGTRSSGDSIRLSNGSVNSLWGNYYFTDRVFRDVGYTDAGELIYNTDTELRVVVGIYCSPLKEAMGSLLRVYYITAAIGILIVLLMRKLLIKHLTGPVTALTEAMADGWKKPGLDYNKIMCAEIDMLNDQYSSERSIRRGYENEVARLSAALRYASEAEENRRQLTSSIAHELKTPLAIIHSYAEGLQEHIAEDKRDKYLEIIVSETDRMDAMVLEMLDLSRLEAGKVKLARDEFSLAAMIEETFGKFETLSAEKKLNISMDIKDSLQVTADEARIGQVVTNFVSNAVRYTPHGGEIRVKGYARGSETFFFIENTGKHFTEEEKQKIWDTFYRTDKSRNSKGTGLGLAIAKNIVELHGGKVFVYNTELGVQFGFKI